MGYASDGVISYSHNSTNYAITPKVSAYSDSTDKSRLFTFVEDSVAGKKTYINGALSAEDSTNTSQLSGVSTLAIGKGYTGEIGEIAIFTKVLTLQDREAVEDYLGKKWTRKINRASSVSCINGIVTDSGCSNVCSTSVVAGVATPTQVSDGDSGTLSCNAPRYSGAASVSYNCSNGNLNPVGTCDAISCTASGVGYSKTSLAYATSGSGSFACDAGYSGTINYTCTAAGAASDILGTCSAVTCTAPAGSGYAAQSSLAYATSGSGSFSCSNGYTGTKNYTCTSTGVATITGGTCAAVTCTAASGSGYAAQSSLAYATSGSGSFSCATGYTGTKNYTCTSVGAATITGGTCTAITCTAPAGTGYSAQSNLAYATSGSGSFDCTSGTGNINYTCTSTGVATITGGSCLPAVCTGGVVDTSISGTTIHMFTSSGVLNCAGAGARSNVQVLVVAGGGGGTTYGGGGAGAAGGLGRGNGSQAGEIGGNGGNGIAVSITSGSAASYPGFYGGGGGSVSGNASTSSGGTGGGGSGGRAGDNGIANTGGGGGGGMKIGQNTGGTSIVGSGGSGVVIIRYVN